MHIHSPSLLLASAGLLLASGLQAAPPRAAEINNPNITPAEIVSHVKYLASDELGGRGSGTPQNDRAAGYIQSRFKAVGLKPAGEGGSYYQKFSVFTGVKLGEGNSIAFKGASVAAPRLKDEFMPVAFSKNAAADAPLVFAGYGISRPDLGYDDYAGIDVRGKIVVVLRYTPDGDAEGKFGPFARLTYKTMTARDKGAAGILLITGPASDQPENLGVFGLDSATADCGIPAAIIKRSFIEKLLEPSRTSLRDLQIGLAHGKPNSFVIPDARASLKVNVLRQTAPTRNVVGYLEGSDPKLKNEVVVIGAHYDHLGMGGSHSLSDDHTPAIHHGADDNASGTAAVLELAQYFAANRKKAGRSLLFMTFSGEEMGLLGSAHWVNHPTIPLDRIAAMVNLDMVGRMKGEVFDIVGASTSTAWPEILKDAVKPGVKPRSGGGAPFGGSDHQSFAVKNIPVLFFFTGIHSDYHKPSDTWEKINAEGEARLVQFVADTVQRTSWLKERPQFVKSQDTTPSTSPGFRVYLGTVPDYGAEVEGVALSDVRTGSPAEKGGLKGGDIIVEFDGKSIRNVEEYTTVLSGAKPDVPVKVVVMRGKEKVTLTITPAARRN